MNTFLLVLVFTLPSGEPRVAQEMTLHDTIEQCQAAGAKRAAQAKKAVPWLHTICVPVPKAEAQ